MARFFSIPGVVCLVAAFVLSFFTSVSLPFLPALDITRTHFHNKPIKGLESQTLVELRFGIWALCAYDGNGERTCPKTGHGYKAIISNLEKTESVTIGSSWTRGLAIHPVATGVIFVALLLSLSKDTTMTVLSCLASFLAALFTLLAFAVDIALHAYLKHQVNKLPLVQAATTTSAGFWMTFVSLLLLLFAGCAIVFGLRKNRVSNTASYPALSKPQKNFFTRFFKN